MTPVQMKLFMNDVECVLHVPGNIRDDNLTEMTVILDYCVPEKEMRSLCENVAFTLKRKGQMFQNVRLNVIHWISDEEIRTQILPLAMLGIGRGLENYTAIQEQFSNSVKDKRMEVLADHLKLFQARSRLLILLTDGKWKIENENLWNEHLHPFLYRKWIWMDVNGDSHGRLI